jgi:hypothetical protein
LLSKFENEYKIIAYCKETKEVAILNYLKHSILSGGRPVADLLTKEINSVKNKELISIVFENLKDYEILTKHVDKSYQIIIIIISRSTNWVANRMSKRLHS